MGFRDNLKELGTLRRVLAAMTDGTSFGDYVRIARTSRGLTLEFMAKATGMAKSYLSQIETGYARPPREEKVRKIARALGLDKDDLVSRAQLAQLPRGLRERLVSLGRVFDSTEEMIRAILAAHRKQVGEESQEEGGAGADRPIDLASLWDSGLLHHLAEWGDERAAERERLRPIPVINKVAAGDPHDYTDLDYPVGIADEYISAPAELSDPGAFAVRVAGDSMEPRYHEGDVVIVSPARQAGSGDDCFVRFERTGRPGEHKATFKRVFNDGPDAVRLQPLNERHAPLVLKPSEVRAILVAVARYEKL